MTRACDEAFSEAVFYRFNCWVRQPSFDSGGYAPSFLLILACADELSSMLFCSRPHFNTGCIFHGKCNRVGHP
jgi:hypothetical protein